MRRRVYDALNVLIAAGILKKDGKNVYCEVLLDVYILQQGNLENGHSELTNGTPTATVNASPSKKNGTKSKTAKVHTNKQRQVVEEKRKALREYMQRAAGMKYLIERNRLK